MPRDPQGAGTRTETKVEWRNVYRAPADESGRTYTDSLSHETRQGADDDAYYITSESGYTRIAIERITITERVERFPLPPHAGEETKGGAVSDKTPDAVAQARAELEAAMSWLTTDESHRIDALIAAVRAECALPEDEVEEFRKQTAFYRVQAEEFWAEVERLRAEMSR